MRNMPNRSGEQGPWSTRCREGPELELSRILGPERVRTRSELAEALTALRTSAGLTVRALAEHLGIPTATVGDYISGRQVRARAGEGLPCGPRGVRGQRHRGRRAVA